MKGKFAIAGAAPLCLQAMLGAMFGAGAVAETLELNLPLACEVGHTCHIQNYVDTDGSAAARDYKCGTLTYDGHNGTDFRLPSRGKPSVNVLAAADGQVVRTRDGMVDGAFDKTGKAGIRDVECGNGVVLEHFGQWETQYCHLANGSIRVKPGDAVETGQALGRVGLSGLTEYLHLHFTVRHKGKVVDPFAYDAAPQCSGGPMLWAPSIRQQLSYYERAVLNFGFASGPVTMDLIESGAAGAEPPLVHAPALVAFVRAIGLKSGDTQHLVLRNPEGAAIAESRAPALEKNMAQYMLFAGKRKPKDGWKAGTYQAAYFVRRGDKIVLEKAFELGF